MCSPRGKKNRKKKAAFPHISVFMTELERAKTACWHPAQWAAGETQGSNCKCEKVSFSHSFLSSKHSHFGHLSTQPSLLGFQIHSPCHTKYLLAAIGFHPHPEKKAHTLAVFEQHISDICSYNPRNYKANTARTAHLRGQLSPPKPQLPYGKFSYCLFFFF